ncbi:uncharacterized protein LOC134247920 [Saccostrea cucullata]|uniref:uncharacterized protein LOC134247920 n=1 Tax=Saccostrea cuccullata TaxID=36930 RepID=UPI002ED30803
MDTFIHGFIFFLLVKAVAMPSSIMCPYLPLWEARSKTLCGNNPSYYHCLNDQAGNLREACIKPVFIIRGHYPVLSLDLDFIKPVKCPPTHYQPDGQDSNNYRSQTCMYPKSQCDDDGEETCDEGSDVTDRMCQCDHTRGYRSLEYLLGNPRNQSCYHPKSEEKGCAMYNCPNGEELNPAYFCVKKCPEGYHRQKYEFVCVKINPLPSQSPTVKFTSTVKIHTTLVIPITKVNEGMDSMLKSKFSYVSMH